MLNLEENMTNLKDAETLVIIGDSITLTGGGCRYWYVYQRRDRKLYHVMLYDTAAIPGLYENLFIMTGAL